VPLTMEDLLTLEGVGRKTANVILSAKRLEAWRVGVIPLMVWGSLWTRTCAV